MRSFRRETLAMRDMATKMEQNPQLPRPDIGSTTLVGNRAYSEAENKNDIFLAFRWHVWEGDKEKAEQRFLQIMDVFPEVEWKANIIEPGSDPGGYDSTYYVMSGLWMGAVLDITGHRSVLCEQVVIEEVEEEIEMPDPELLKEATKDVPMVKETVTREVKEWQCNQNLAFAIDPFSRRRKEALSNEG